MEVRGEIRGVAVIDDFAHHPTAIRETIDAIRQKYQGRRIVAVFEPRSYTAQRREFQNDYVKAFRGADEIVFASLFRPDRYTKETALDLEQLVRDLASTGKGAKQLKERRCDRPGPGATARGPRCRPGDVEWWLRRDTSEAP